MVEIADIVGRDSLRTWLEGQPQEVSVWIAHRSAMRVLPIWWDFALPIGVTKNFDLTALPVLRCNFISGVARTIPDIQHAVFAAADTAIFAAANAVADTATHVSDAVDAADAAAHAAAYAAFAADAVDATAAADRAADAAADTAGVAARAAAATYAAVADHPTAAAATENVYVAAASAYWKLIQTDCTAITSGADLDRLPLWGGQENPLADVWAKVKAQMPTASPSRSEETARGAPDVDWSFWVKWYDDALAGNPPNWKMLERIALIDPAEWDKGAKRVNFLIGEIEKEFAREATPYPENLTYDGEYHVAPISELPTRTLEDARDRIADVSRDMRKGGNQYSALGDEADVLDDVLARYPDRAIRLFEVCHKVVGHVARHVENGVLPEGDNLIGDVLGDLQNSADDIYNFDVDVRASVDARAKLRFGRLDQGQRDTVVALAEAMAQNSDADLAEEMREDAAEVMAADDPEGESKPARYRLGSRLVRVLVLGGAGLAAVLGTLAAVEPAVSGAQYLWQIIRPLIGF